MALKLTQTIRLDPSDTFVCSCAAELDERAMTGAFRLIEFEEENAASPEVDHSARAGWRK